MEKFKKKDERLEQLIENIRKKKRISKGMFSPLWCAAPVLSNDRPAPSTTLNKNNKLYKDEKNKIKYKKYDKMR